MPKPNPRSAEAVARRRLAKRYSHRDGKPLLNHLYALELAHG